MSTATIVAILSLCVAALSAGSAWRSRDTASTKQAAAQLATILAKLDALSAQIEKLEATTTTTKHDVEKLEHRVTALENQLHAKGAKLMLNNLYGKFSTNPHTGEKVPHMIEDRVIWETTNGDDREAVYIPVGAYCTAYARNVTLTAAQKNFGRFAYADTDSIHVIGEKPVDTIDVDPYRLGAWKHEGVFTQAKYLHAKLYVEKIRDPDDEPGTEQWIVTGAGMTKECKKRVDPLHFDVGQRYAGKLRPKKCPGGVVLEETTFTIR